MGATGSGRIPAALLAAALLTGTSSPARGTDPPAGDPGSVWIHVRTLVVDALGTRTVDESTARVGFGQRGLLMSRVPYGGPPLAYRLFVRPDPPAGEEIPLTITSEIWPGDPDRRPPDEQVTRRREVARLVPGTSYLLELAHDRTSPQAERRILLSFTVSPDRPAPVQGARTARVVNFLLQVIRSEGSVISPADTHALSSLEGHPVTYSSETRPVPGGEAIGLDVSLTAEQVSGDLITVRVRIEGADAPGPEGGGIRRVSHESRHTVRAGQPILVESRSGSEGPADEGGPAGIVYTVTVTPTLG